MQTPNAVRRYPFIAYNRAMPRLALLLPFALPPAELAPDLRRQLVAPALATLCARARRAESETGDAFARALPHERWLARQFDLATNTDTSPPIAAAWMQAHGLDAGDGHWFVLHPVHIHIARDHLVLTDPRSLDLSESESRALFEMAQPLFEEYGRPLLYGDAGTWFTRADAWRDLCTATPDAASGHNIDLWMPRGPGERDWRKLQNEVQMHWFAHPLNAEREARGARTVNSLWLWGGAEAGRRPVPRHDAAFNLRGWMQALGHDGSSHAQHVAELTLGHHHNTLLVLDSLLAPALASDWGRWIEELHALEQNWFAPLLDALRGGSLDELSLIASGEKRLLHLTITRTTLRKFWRKPSLDTLLT